MRIMDAHDIAELLQKPGGRGKEVRGANTARQYAARLMRMKNILCPGEPRDLMRNWSWMDDHERVEKALWDGTIIKGQNGNSSTEPRSVMAYYCALVAAADAALPKKRETADWYRQGVKQCQTHNREHDRRQELETSRYEHLRWPMPADIINNLYALRDVYDPAATTDTKSDQYWTMRHLLYTLYVSMREQCVFRLDVVYKTRLLLPDSSPPEEPCSYFRVDPRTNEPVTLMLGDYKTRRSYGDQHLVMPRAFSDLLYHSMRRFPRTWFIPRACDADEPMTQPNASAFVKSCWIYDDREHKPCADDIRSSLATLFWFKHQRLVDTEAFARRSLTSRATMEASYYKTDPDILKGIAEDMDQCENVRL